MNHKRPTIALLMDHFLGDYQTVLRDAVEIASKERDVDLLCVIGRSLDSPNDYEKIQNEIFGEVTSKSVSGVIVLSSNLSLNTGKEPIADFCRGFRPLPVCSVGLRIPGVPSVVPDNRLISLSVRHLAEQHGCRRFAYIGGPLANEEAAVRRDAVVEGLRALGLPLLPELEEVGTFTVRSGCEAASRILLCRAPFDALVAANDTMALGAMSVLKKSGLQVPSDVKVMGFDDIPAGRFSAPRLSTIRQRLEEIGRHAVELVLMQIRGETAPIAMEVAPRLVRRQSCGCPHGIFSPAGMMSLGLGEASLVDAVKSKARQLEELLVRNVHIPEMAFSRWARRLIEALAREAGGGKEEFTKALGDLLESADNRLWIVDELQNAISLLKELLKDAERTEAFDLGSVWYEARMLLADAAIQGNIKNQVAANLASALFLRRTAADQPNSLTDDELVSAITGELEAIGVENGLVSAFPKGRRDVLECIAAIRDGAPLPIQRDSYDVDMFIPPFLERDRRMSYVVIPLSSGKERLGVMVIEAGAADIYYEILRVHMSSYLKHAGTAKT